MEGFVANHLGEMMVSLVLGALAIAFRAWSTSIKEATNTILDKLDYLTKEFHQHRVDIERRVTRVETKVDWVHMDTHYHPSDSKNPDG